MWWEAAGEPEPIADMLPEESTYIVEQQGNPVLCATLYLLNTKAFAWVDNLIARPGIHFERRKEAVNALCGFLEEKAKEKGIQRLFCFSEKEPLKRRYEELGFRPTLEGVTTFIKEL